MSLSASTATAGACEDSSLLADATCIGVENCSTKDFTLLVGAPVSESGLESVGKMAATPNATATATAEANMAGDLFNFHCKMFVGDY
jgi:hypothetical protein